MSSVTNKQHIMEAVEVVLNSESFEYPYRNYAVTLHALSSILGVEPTYLLIEVFPHMNHLDYYDCHNVAGFTLYMDSCEDECHCECSCTGLHKLYYAHMQNFLQEFPYRVNGIPNIRGFHRDSRLDYPVPLNVPTEDNQWAEAVIKNLKSIGYEPNIYFDEKGELRCIN